MSEIKTLGGTETILVVEDETDLRELVCQALKKSGYTVIEARDGLEALEHLKSYEGAIHLVITDVVMPRMGGQELSLKAKEMKLNSKFLFLSGYTEDVLLQQGTSSDQASFLEKPYTLKSLLNKVRTLLEDKQ